MYCKKCGRKIADGDLFCRECGTPAGRSDGGRQNNQGYGSYNNFGAVNADHTVSAENEYRGNYGYGNYGSGGNYSGQNNYGYNQYDTQKSTAKKSGAGKLIAALLIIAAVVGVGVSVFVLITTSDWFKLAGAEADILDGKYSEGLEKIESLDSDRAKSVRAFVEILKLRDGLEDAYDVNTLCDADSEAFKTAKDFKEKLASFSEDYKPETLTEKLREQFTDYSEASADIAKLLYDSKVSEDFATAQVSVSQYDARKKGMPFTVDSMEETNADTQKAYDNIVKNLTDTEEYKEFAEDYEGKAETALTEFQNTINRQIAQDSYEIEKFGKKYGSKSIFYSNPDQDHKAVVADGLEYADSEENIEKNAGLLVSSLDCAMLINAFKQ